MISILNVQISLSLAFVLYRLIRTGSLITVAISSHEDMNRLLHNNTFLHHPAISSIMDVRMGGVGGGRRAPNVLIFARKLVKSQPCCTRVGNGSFRDLFIVAIVGQLIKTSLRKGVSARYCPTSPNNAEHRWPVYRNICTQHCWHLLGKNIGLVWPGL